MLRFLRENKPAVSGRAVLGLAVLGLMFFSLPTVLDAPALAQQPAAESAKTKEVQVPAPPAAPLADPSGLPRIGEIIVQGNDLVPEPVIREQLQLIPGSRLDSADLRGARRELLKIRFLKECWLTVLDDHGSEYKPILVTVTERE